MAVFWITTQPAITGIGLLFLVLTIGAVRGKISKS
jgi:hypothetical protein